MRGKEGKNERWKEEKKEKNERFFLPSYLLTFRWRNVNAMEDEQTS